MKIFILLLVCSVTFAAFENIKIWTDVVSAIHLSKLKDLDFNDGLQGDPAKTIAPEQGAEFIVSGEPCRSFSILIPETVVMRTGNGSSPQEQIVVNQFRSVPEKMGKLECTGKQTLKVGATRAAISQLQKSGTYLAPFTVTVLY